MNSLISLENTGCCAVLCGVVRCGAGADALKFAPLQSEKN